jgi:hypothetical protein
VSDYMQDIRQSDRAQAFAEIQRLTRALAAAEAALHEAKVQAEARYDCHGGPGTTSEACGACNACITRRAESAEQATEDVRHLCERAVQNARERAVAAEAERDRAVAFIYDSYRGKDRVDGLPCWCPSPTLAAFNRAQEKHKDAAGHVPYCAKARAIVGGAAPTTTPEAT